MTDGPDFNFAELWRRQIEDHLKVRYYLSGEAQPYPKLSLRQRLRTVVWMARWRLAQWMLPRDVRYLLDDED